MVITELQLKNFRNLNLNFKPATGFNLIVGENGAGKSNLLDALYHLALVKTFKPYSLKNNINFNHPSEFALIKASIANEDQLKEMKIVFALDNKNTTDEDGNPIEPSEQKRLELNAKSTTRSKFIHNLYVILFAPHNINLLIGTPDLRRAELDDFASICDYKYAAYINDYKEVVRNRNRLLKAIFEGKAQESQLAFWDGKLIQLGTFLTLERRRILDKLIPKIAALAQEHFEGELQNIGINYYSRILKEAGSNDEQTVKACYKELLLTNRKKEIYSRQSQYGPHKDDF
ncbi:MAG: AAA family ATPase, partial [archaeon]